MLRLPPFRLRTPRDLAEAVAILDGEGAGARLLAGGTDLLPNLKRRHQRAATVVRLTHLPGLSGIHDGNGSGARVGATTTLDEVARHELLRGRYPALAAAAAAVASPPIRSTATLGGNLCVDTRCTYYNQTEEWRRAIDYCMKADGTVCWVAPGSPRCWAHSASDTAPVLAALGAEVELVGRDGRRRLPVADLYRDDGIDYLGKRPEEILTAVHLGPDAAAEACRSAFRKVRRRGSIDFAVLSVAVALWLDAGGRVERARIHLGAVASHPVAATQAAEALLGEVPTPELIAHAARLARKVATPMDNTDFQAQWRGVMVERTCAAALREALADA